MMTLLVVGGFCVANIYVVNTKLPAGFIPLEDQVHDLRDHPDTCARLDDRGNADERGSLMNCRWRSSPRPFPGVNSVSSLAGYEVLYRGPRFGTRVPVSSGESEALVVTTQNDS